MQSSIGRSLAAEVEEISRWAVGGDFGVVKVVRVRVCVCVHIKIPRSKMSPSRPRRRINRGWIGHAPFSRGVVESILSDGSKVRGGDSRDGREVCLLFGEVEFAKTG